MRLRVGLRDFTGAGFELFKPVRNRAYQRRPLSRKTSRPGGALNLARTRSISSGVGGAFVAGLPVSNTSTPVTPFAGCTSRTLISMVPGLVATIRVSSRWIRRKTSRTIVGCLPFAPLTCQASCLHFRRVSAHDTYGPGEYWGLIVSKGKPSTCKRRCFRSQSTSAARWCRRCATGVLDCSFTRALPFRVVRVFRLEHRDAGAKYLFPGFLGDLRAPTGIASPHRPA